MLKKLTQFSFFIGILLIPVTLTTVLAERQDKAISVMVECIVPNEDGTFTARFGYYNRNAYEVELAVGDENFFNPSPQGRGQPTVFQPGRAYAAFEVIFDGDPLVWSIAGPGNSRRNTTASRHSTRCTGFGDDSTPEATPEVTNEVDPTEESTPQVTPDPTGTEESTPEVTPDPTATDDSTPEVTPDPSATASATDDGTGGGDPSSTPTATASATDDGTGGGDPSSTPTATASATDDGTGGGDPSSTPSATASATDDGTGGGDPSSTPSATSTATASATDDRTGGGDPSSTPSTTSTATASATDDGSPTPTTTLTLPPTEEVIIKSDNQVIEIDVNNIDLNALPPLQGKYVVINTIDGQARPTFHWELAENSAATWFDFVLAVENSTLTEKWLKVEDVCNGTICQYTPGLDVLPQDVLLNGSYDWWMYSWASAYSATWESYQFTVDVPEPTLPVVQVAVNNAEPILSWVDDNNTAWYQVWIGTLDLVTVYNAWHSQSELCDDVTCHFTLPQELEQGSYDVYVQSWGAGGFNSNTNSGWAGPFNFLVQAPALVTEMRVENSALKWNASAGATWYQVWVGSGAPYWSVAHMEWHEASTLGCANGGVCTLNLSLPAGEYVWFVQAYGPGGITDDGLDGWADGGSFSR